MGPSHTSFQQLSIVDADGASTVGYTLSFRMALRTVATFIML